MRNITQFILIFLSLNLYTNSLQAQRIIQSQNFEEPLQARWKSALNNSEKNQEFWVGYSIKRLMSEKSYIGSHYNDETYPTLYELISGKVQPSGESKEHRGRKVYEWNDEECVEKVLKDVAVLFEVSKKGEIEKVNMNNLDLPFDLEDRNLYWLGHAEYDESIGLLKDLFNRSEDNELKEDFISAIGIHSDSHEGFEFLKEIIESERKDELREQAVFWIAQHNNKNVLPLMKQIALNDYSEDVQEKAVFGLYVIDSDESVAVLIDLAKNANKTHIRKKAMFWLGQTASKKAVETIESAVYNDEDTEIQKQAVFALSQLGTDDSITKLIKVAETHQNPEIRKKAIFWLGQSEDERALDAIIGFLK